MEPVVNMFYRYLKDEKIMGLKCPSCGTILFPPQGLCPKCGGSDLSWVPMSGRGKVVSASVGPHRMMGIDAYLQATVKLEEGPLVSGMLLDDAFDFTRPEGVLDYYGGGVDVKAEIVTNPEGAKAVAFRVVKPRNRGAGQ